jgi:hypothetical protein
VSSAPSFGTRDIFYRYCWVEDAESWKADDQLTRFYIEQTHLQETHDETDQAHLLCFCVLFPALFILRPSRRERAFFDNRQLPARHVISGPPDDYCSCITPELPGTVPTWLWWKWANRWIQFYECGRSIPDVYATKKRPSEDKFLFLYLLFELFNIDFDDNDEPSNARNSSISEWRLKRPSRTEEEAQGWLLAGVEDGDEHDRGPNWWTSPGFRCWCGSKQPGVTCGSLAKSSAIAAEWCQNTERANVNGT